MNDERCLRPHARPALLLAGLTFGGQWTLLAGFTAYAAVWWPEPPILESMDAERFGGLLALSLTAFSIPMVGWLWERRVMWRVGSEGITVYRRGRLRRSLGWPEVTAIEILRFGVFVRFAARPREEAIHWLASEDLAWLRGIARERLGHSLVL